MMKMQSVEGSVIAAKFATSSSLSFKSDNFATMARAVASVCLRFLSDTAMIGDGAARTANSFHDC